jgi:hypothetical protein
MDTTQIESVISTMNAMERARALRAMHQALLIERLFIAIGTRVGRAARSARHAMTLVYGRGFEH